MRKKLNVIKVLRKAGVRDYARAAAQDADTIGRDCNNANSGPGADDDIYVGESDNETPQSGLSQDDPYWAQDGGISSGPSKSESGKTNDDKSFGQKLLEELAGGISKNAGNILKANTSRSTGGKNLGKDAGNVLLGLGEDYVKECVRKYKKGESMTEFERRIAMAAIKLEKEGKNLARRKIMEWIENHLPEIGLGFLGVIVLVTIIAKRK